MAALWGYEISLRRREVNRRRGSVVGIVPSFELGACHGAGRRSCGSCIQLSHNLIDEDARSVAIRAYSSRVNQEIVVKCRDDVQHQGWRQETWETGNG